LFIGQEGHGKKLLLSRPTYYNLTSCYEFESHAMHNELRSFREWGERTAFSLYPERPSLKLSLVLCTHFWEDHSSLVHRGNLRCALVRINSNRPSSYLYVVVNQASHEKL
jgi:hypothetical protein